MFSRRLPWHVSSNKISQALAHKRATNAPVLDLTESNPTRSGITYPESAILEAFQNPAMLVYDPESAGLQSAREYIANAFALHPANLILTSSTSEAYSWLFKLLCDPGDEVLAPQPSYPLFDHLASLESVTVTPYPLVYGGEWSIDVHELKQRITPRTRAIVIVNPNNPTGSYVTARELEELSATCAEHDLALISDEVFADYYLNPGHMFRPAALSVNTTAFSLNGLSKLVGMPQMKLGWILTNNEHAHQRLELIADTYLSVGTPVQYALPALLAARESIQTQIRARLRANLAVLQARFRPRAVEGGWYAVLQVPRTLSEEQWVLMLLEEESLLVQPGYFYDFTSEAFLILSLLTPPETFAEGLDCLARAMERYC
ncbi:MAG: pyridoxal phosphate-dependent aminotransferase [Acidobacteriota bacterium]|nr:pyridoxal phosphate-dependent aminotransferase [Acidobacteriota bacterium]